MKSKLLTAALACSSVYLAHAQFNPLALTQNSYTFSVVVPAGTIQDVPDTINVTAGNGTGLGDNTYFEQGLFSRPGTPGGNIGVPLHNTVFTNINNANMTFLMPPDYTVNNDLMIDSSFGSGSLTFNTPTTATSLAILCCGGGGPLTVNYVVSHTDGGTETGTLSLLDWFNGGPTVAWGANGRIQDNGGYNNINTSAANNNPPYLYGNTISISDSSTITNIAFSNPSGNHGNFFGVSGSTDGTTYTPIPVSGFNVMAIVPAAIPFPVNATMDQGTNLINNGNGMNTWYEQGYDRNAGGTGLPPSGSSFTSITQPTHTYQMGNYSTNDSILIDTNHLVSNITPVTPAAYTAISLLTAGGNIGGNNIMTNLIIIQHQDGVNETNLFYGYDWYNTANAGAYAFIAQGRVDMYNRTLNTVGNPFPCLFESYFTLQDLGSAITNIQVQYKSAPGASATTFIMAVSASTAPVPPIVDVGPLPSPQTVYPGANITFTVGASGSQPITGYWQKDNNGTYSTLSDGPDADGSIISGSHTFVLSISNVYPADATNYQFVANNTAGSGTSPAGVLIVSPQTVSITPATPVFYNSNNIPLTASVVGGPVVKWQWYYIDTSGDGTTNYIAGATNSSYTIVDAQDAQNGYIYGAIAYNVYATNTAQVILNISDSAAFLAADLSPTNAEAYVGAPVTYAVNAKGNSPITYQWLVNGSPLSGNDSNSLTLPAACGITTVQVMFSNLLSGATWISSREATLQGDAFPTNLSFAGNGANWQINGSPCAFTNNVLLLTDGGGGEDSSAFFNTAQYVGGSWTASYTYDSHGGSADGTAFILQNVSPTVLGGGGGLLGYGGTNANSLAFLINLYGGNGETPGVAGVTDGTAGGSTYSSAAPVSTTSTNPINVVLTWNNGVLSASLTDTGTQATFSTNYNLGSLVSILGGDLAYVGFSGADGGATSIQTVSNFHFQSILPAVSLTAASAGNGKITLSWPVADADYEMETTSSLKPVSWTAGPAPTVVGSLNEVTITVTAGSDQFYRLARVACP